MGVGRGEKFQVRDGEADRGSSCGLWPGKALLDLGHFESSCDRTRWGRERGYERKRSRLSPACLGVESWHYNLKGRWFEGGEGVGSRKKSVERKPLPLSCVNLVQILVQITSRSWI